MASQKLPTSQNTFNPQVIDWVPKFKGENYDQWSIQMMSIFIAQGIWDIIQDGHEIPKNDDEESSWDETKKESYKLNMRRNHCALSIIHRGVDETILPEIMAATTAKEAWHILKTKSAKLKQMEITVSEEMDKVATSLQNMIPECSIYLVPYYFRKGKEECYQPLEISIGPVFYKDPKLATMQQFKWVFLKYFIQHPDNASRSVEPYIRLVREREREIRKCYQHQMKLSSNEFIQMIVLDAAFLIYYFLLEALFSKSHHRPACRTPHDPAILNLAVAYDRVWRDLFVEENQLPFFVLKRIYDNAFGHLNSCLPFTDLVLANIRLTTTTLPWHHAIKSNIDGKKITDASGGRGIKHLVHLLRVCCLPFDVLPRDSEGHLLTKCCLPFCQQQRDSEVRSAKRLSDAGVRFKLNESNDQFSITFDKSTGELKVSKLTLDDNSEAYFRNILFFEQCWPDYENKYFADLFCFLDDLIDTVEDIQILKKSQILDNQLGSDEDAKDLFNNLAKNIIVPNLALPDVRQGLKVYSNTRWNRWKAILWSKYFNHPWAVISVSAAVILLILTVLQTTIGFLQLD